MLNHNNDGSFTFQNYTKEWILEQVSKTNEKERIEFWNNLLKIWEEKNTKK